MVRLLIMGRGAAQWAQRIEQIVGPGLEVDSARLPAEGIRRFEATPPDALLVVDPTGGARARTLIQAIQNRPLGRLLPILLISAAPEPEISPDAVAAELGIEAWMPLDVPPREVLGVLAVALELPARALLDADGARLAEHDDFVMERVDADDVAAQDDEDDQEPPPAQDAPGTSARPTPSGADVDHQGDPSRPEGARAEVPFRPEAGPISVVDRASLFPVRARDMRTGEVSEEVLRRKLKEVRHEDYYTILEVRRGAETAVLRDAYQRLTARYDSARLDFELVRRFHDELGEIRDAIEDAWAVLGDPSLRQAYVRANGPRR